ncbi:RING finger protein 151-like isoform X1 [Girardinichthys multiradiatus]|uniref:RING finger protein 151-like isoform X1 n=1 Tax=Girardinichthys multiradiatus TaxID=208333 RepID=UPI001FAB7F43|nr:RING finger protein 151-like isoform X1 [Girardinichthys multiradiatus]
MADPDVSTQSGGYDVELFVDPPDYDLICTICQGVFRCPVRSACHHIFCKKCILQWLKRQETCPCCRKPVNSSLIFVMFKLSKSIGRMKIKCKNQIRGCTETFTLSEQYCHSMGCLYELIPCPYQGCRAQLLRRDLETHARHCEHWRQPCHMGCGTILTHSTQAQHNCYKQLRQEYETRQRNHRAIATTLQRKMRRMQSTMAHMRRQIGLICESLEVMDDLHEVEEEVDLGESSSSSSSGTSSSNSNC